MKAKLQELRSLRDDLYRLLLQKPTSKKRKPSAEKAKKAKKAKKAEDNVEDIGEHVDDAKIFFPSRLLQRFPNGSSVAKIDAPGDRMEVVNFNDKEGTYTVNYCGSGAWRGDEELIKDKDLMLFASTLPTRRLKSADNKVDNNADDNNADDNNTDDNNADDSTFRLDDSSSCPDDSSSCPDDNNADDDNADDDNADDDNADDNNADDNNADDDNADDDNADDNNADDNNADDNNADNNTDDNDANAYNNLVTVEPTPEIDPDDDGGNAACLVRIRQRGRL